jgi:hypothetical protein
MKFKDFLQSVSQPDFWTSSKIYCFTGSEFCSLFFNKIFNFLEQNQKLPYPKKSLSSENLKNEYHSYLEQSILGNYNFYWLGNLSEQSKNTKLLNYLFNYQGCHTIAFFVPNDFKNLKLSDNAVQIEIDSNINISDVKAIVTLFNPKISDKKIALIDKIFGINSDIDIDSACMLINYFELINVNSSMDESCSYLCKIFGVQPVLSQLSNAFWTKNSKDFFKIWQKIEPNYPEVFWVIFWSEQIWKAYHTISFLNQKNFVKAKQMSYGLPFSFISRDFKNFKPASLVSLYENLYEIDFAIKNGSTFYSLDLFYLNHFNQVNQ